MTKILPLGPATGKQPPAPQMNEARQVARELEVSFLAEMLKSAGVGEQTSEFSGGVGENQFAVFQRQALAQDMVDNGGLGLAEHIFKSLMEKNHDH